MSLLIVDNLSCECSVNSKILSCILPVFHYVKCTCESKNCLSNTDKFCTFWPSFSLSVLHMNSTVYVWIIAQRTFVVSFVVERDHRETAAEVGKCGGYHQHED